MMKNASRLFAAAMVASSVTACGAFQNGGIKQPNDASQSLRKKNELAHKAAPQQTLEQHVENLKEMAAYEKGGIQEEQKSQFPIRLNLNFGRTANYPAFQFIDQTNVRCNNFQAYDAFPFFTYESEEFDDICSKGERNLDALANPAIQGEQRKVFKALQKQQLPYQLPVSPDKGCPKSLLIRVLGILQFDYSKTYMRCMFEGAARDMLSVQRRIPSAQNVALALYTSKDPDEERRVLTAAFAPSATGRFEGRRPTRGMAPSRYAQAEPAAPVVKTQQNCRVIGKIKGRDVVDCAAPGL